MSGRLSPPSCRPPRQLGSLMELAKSGADICDTGARRLRNMHATSRPLFYSEELGIANLSIGNPDLERGFRGTMMRGWNGIERADAPVGAIFSTIFPDLVWLVGKITPQADIVATGASRPDGCDLNRRASRTRISIQSYDGTMPGEHAEGRLEHDLRSTPVRRRFPWTTWRFAAWRPARRSSMARPW